MLVYYRRSIATALILGGITAFLIENVITHRHPLDFTSLWFAIVFGLLAIICALVGYSISRSIKLKKSNKDRDEFERVANANIKDSKTLRDKYNSQNEELSILLQVLTPEQLVKFSVLISNHHEGNDD